MQEYTSLHCSQNKHKAYYSRHLCKQPHKNIEPSQVTAAAPAALALMLAVLKVGEAEDDIETAMPQSKQLQLSYVKRLAQQQIITPPV
jgi:hypothetical protein